MIEEANAEEATTPLLPDKALSDDDQSERSLTDDPKAPLEWKWLLLFAFFDFGSAWVVLDSMWVEISYWEQYQPEGASLSSKMTVAETLVAVPLIPLWLWLEDKINYRQLIYVICILNILNCILLAFLWDVVVNQLSLILYAVTFLSSMVGDLNSIAVLPYFTQIDNRLTAPLSTGTCLGIITIDVSMLCCCISLS